MDGRGKKERMGRLERGYEEEGCSWTGVGNGMESWEKLMMQEGEKRERLQDRRKGMNRIVREGI